jgi:flagellar basal-body rod modification protein FlgD
MVSSVSNTTASSAANLTSTNTGTTSAQEQSDRFLKLLVAQLNNQDPMNPMDNAQMTSQIAQINTVSGIQTLNDTVKSLTSQFTAMQVMQGASLTGRQVLTAGNALPITNGVGNASVDLASAADKVTVQVLTPGGQDLGKIELGSATAGQHSFNWDASNYSGSAPPVFKVTATLGGKPVTATALTPSTIDSVSTNASGAMSVNLSTGTSVAYDAIKTIY